MANNRMWLCHKPSGLAVLIGKGTIGWWIHDKVGERLNALYDMAEKDYRCFEDSDFVLLYENQPGWRYGPDDNGEFRRIIFE